MPSSDLKLTIEENIWKIPYSIKKFLSKKKNRAQASNLDLDRLPKNYQSLIGPIYYIIHVNNGGHGFFSNFFHVLFHISIADFYNWVPVVDMKNYKTLYNEKKKIFSTNNSWEYYFRQQKSLSQINFKKIK